MCDGDLPQCYTAAIRKARKPHRCCECSAGIVSGQKYFHFKGIWSGDAQEYRMCLECLDLRDYVSRESGCFSVFHEVLNDAEYYGIIDQSQNVRMAA